MSGAKLKLHDKSTSKTLTIQSGDGTLPEDVVITLPSGNATLVSEETLNSAIESAGSNTVLVNQPVITTPVDGTSNFTGIVTASVYSTADTYVGTHDSTTWQFSTTADFTNIVLESTVGNLTSITPVIGMALTTVYVRVKYISGVNASKWSEPISFITPNVYISTPSITVEGTPSSILETPLMSGSTFTVVNGTDTHASSTWTVIKVSDGSTVWDSVNDTVNKLNIRVPAGILNTGTEYKFTVKYNGTMYGASGTAEITGTTLSTFINLGEDGLNTILAGNTTTGAYFGELTVANLVADRNYRGPYKTGTTFKAGTQVSHLDKLWNALVDVTDVTPGTNASKWEEDTREGLPTGKWLLDVCGVGYGLNDANADGYSTTSASIGALKNNDQGFLKFAKNGKILYIAKKPFVGTIGWNDLAKRNLVYGDRTVRVGSRLYYVRLVTEAEYLDCLVASTNGTLANLATTDLALEEKTWLYDTQIGAVRKAYSGISTLENIDPKSRVGSYRPVLELIEEGNEPYLNLPNCPAATNENFQYDKFTDTGYFGEVPTTSILSGSALASSIGLTAGTAQHDTAGYLKFYWHGKILYVAKRPFRHTVSWDNIKAANAVFGVDLGGSGKATVAANGYTYIVQLLTGAGKAPADDAQYWTNDDNFAANILLEIGKFSQWNELIYRVHQTVVDDVLANQDGQTSYYGYTGGVQIGANWANFNNVDLVVYYTEGGNGTVTWTQETSVDVTSERVHRGYYRLAYLRRTASSTADTGRGWRPSLCLS